MFDDILIITNEVINDLINLNNLHNNLKIEPEKKRKELSITFNVSESVLRNISTKGLKSFIYMSIYDRIKESIEYQINQNKTVLCSYILPDMTIERKYYTKNVDFIITIKTLWYVLDKVEHQKLNRKTKIKKILS